VGGEIQITDQAAFYPAELKLRSNYCLHLADLLCHAGADYARIEES